MATPRRCIKNEDKMKKNSPKQKSLPSSPRPIQVKRHFRSSNNSESSFDDEDECELDETDQAFVNSSDNVHKYGSFNKQTKNSFLIDSSLSHRTKHVHNDETYRDRNTGSNESRTTKGLYPNLSEKELTEHKRYKESFKKFGPTPIILILMVLLVICSIIILAYYIVPLFQENELMPANRTLKEIHDSIKKDLRVLHKDVDQPRHFWVQVLSQIDDLFEVDPRQPSILLVLIPSDSMKTATCLVHKLQEIVSFAFGDKKLVMLDGQSNKQYDSNTVKHQLDQSLSELSSHHVAVIHNLEKLPPETAMILHAYCDNENAPHKRALIILTIGSSLPYDSLSEESASANIDEILEKLWRDKIRDVDIPAIVSRIANAPILVKPETNKVIDFLCPYK